MTRTITISSNGLTSEFTINENNEIDIFGSMVQVEFGNKSSEDRYVVTKYDKGCIYVSSEGKS